MTCIRTVGFGAVANAVAAPKGRYSCPDAAELVLNGHPRRVVTEAAPAPESMSADDFTQSVEEPALVAMAAL
ncbi:hypothetical protein J2Y41_003914 [Arthrobacter sp. 1088]|uniref:hypothetical protein n=1 Tax=Arthrobacter sp. 1088 TaxID=2817768 RepID=UPI002862FBB9|nr:hypothetical protein [Arthrobacter sp. 1088]MDR6688328.1 hypothetical protein [Arthrobacter sp. 1088]